MRFFVLRLVPVMCALLLVAGYGGRFHGAGDSLALLRPVLVPVILLFSIGFVLMGPRLWGTGGAVLAVAAGTSLTPGTPVSFVDDETPVYGLYQKNLLFLLPDTAPLVRDILTERPDFVTLQEVHSNTQVILDELREAYPYQSFCPFAGVGGTAVLSRWVSVREICNEGSGIAAMQVETPSGRLWVVSLHLHWPFPFRQSEQVAWVVPMLDALEGPVVLGGDFNMVRWSWAVGELARASKAQLAGSAGGTFTLSYHLEGQDVVGGLPRLPIDHVLIPGEAAPVSVRRMDQLGSDHNGVLAVFAMP